MRNLILKRNSILYIRLAIILAVLVSIMFTFFIKSVSHAQTKNQEYTYVSVKIEDGDTINDIASKYLSNTLYTHSQLVSEIMRVNFLSSDIIHSGAYIVVPIILE